MSTTCTIALEYENGTIDQVYCHWCGDTNGKLLLTHYTSPFKLQKLMDLGDLSYLCANVEPSPTGLHHFYNPQEGVCVFYGRDRGEDGTEAARFTDFLDYVQDGAWQGYDYILRNDGVWYVSKKGQQFRKLADVVAG